ncbi:MAG TPA: ABC transporter permease [Planctomycetes bacterium]|nr:ABC transporter permease [Planctomycetota bacterium]
MWAYILRRLLYNIPVYLGIIALLMVALRVNDPVWGFLGKNADQEAYEVKKHAMGLDRPFHEQYIGFLGELATFDFERESWTQQGRTVGDLVADSIGPSLAITVPAMALTTLVALVIAILSAYTRGRLPDKFMMVSAVLGMSISFLVYIIFGQYWGAYVLNDRLGTEVFAIQGYESGLANWKHYCLLPVLISTIVAVGYDTRFYRAVMVEETNRDYIVTARAKGAGKGRIMFVHMLKNAMIPIVTRVMITMPFLVMGSLLLEVYFNIPGMGRALYKAISENDFPVTEVLVALFAGVFILTVILTDVIYALVDPRVRLQ